MEIKDKLKNAMEEANKRLAADGIKVQGGKQYLMVKDRISIFRETFGLEYGITTLIQHQDSSRCIVQAWIRDDQDRPIASGLAEEIRSDQGMNSSSCLEVAETSAIGRALACLGLHGGEYASADEMISAVATQGSNKPPAPIDPSDWQEAIVPNTKNKGKKLGELTEKSLMWYIEEWQPYGDNPSDHHKAFRAALDAAEKAKFAGGEDIIAPIDEVAEQTANDPTDPDLEEEVPF